jgi:hypothetical protein
MQWMLAATEKEEAPKELRTRKRCGHQTASLPESRGRIVGFANAFLDPP